jgi:uncharacterized membrane protein HdeD (DUF308 family)
MTTREETAVVAVGVDLSEIARSWGSLLALGVVTVLAGCAAIILPQAATIAIELLLGILLVLDGILQGIHAGQLRGRKGFGWKLAGSILSLAAGVLLLAFPLAGVLTLTLIVAVFFLAGGLLKIILSAHFRALAGWWWLLLSGLVTFLLGAAILLAFPEAASWVVGLLVGIALFLDGWWLIGTGLSLRRLRPGGVA